MGCGDFQGSACATFSLTRTCYVTAAKIKFAFETQHLLVEVCTKFTNLTVFSTNCVFVSCAIMTLCMRNFFLPFVFTQIRASPADFLGTTFSFFFRSQDK